MPDKKIIDLDALKKFRQEADQRYLIEGEYSPTTSVGQADSIASDREIDNADQACPPITFRNTGGNAEIQTGYNKFEELRGNSIVWNQLAKGLNATNYNDESNNRTFDSNNNSTSITVNTSAGSGAGRIEGRLLCSYNSTLLAQHKYLVKIVVDVDASIINKRMGLSVSTWHYSSYRDFEIGNNYVSIIFTQSATETGAIQIRLFGMDSTNDGTTLTYKDVQIFDLTQMFGVGNEPTSALEFNRDYPLPYYEYNVGQLLSDKSSSLDSIGMNQFQALDTYIEVIAGEIYDISGISAGGYIEEYDYDKNLIKTSEEITETTQIKLTDNTHFVKVQATTYTDIMLRLYWDTNNVSYKPYEKQTVALPDIELRSAGSVQDVIYSSGGGKRRVSEPLQLGTLTASQFSTNAHTFRLPAINNLKPSSSYNSVANVLCNLYETKSISDVSDGQDGIAVHDVQKYFIITDNNYDATTPQGIAVFNAHLNDVYAQYELLEETDIENNGWNELVKTDNYGTLKFNSSQAIQVPQAYFIRYTVSLTEWLDSAYAYSDGAPSNLALKTDITEAISHIPTGDFGFPIIDAPSSTTLTNDEVTTISSGAVFLGSSSNKFLTYEKIVFFPLGEASFGENKGFALCVNGFTPELRCYQINSSNVISIADATTKRTRLQSIAQINGKNIPDYPSSTGTFVLKCVNGTLTWVQE